MDGGTVVGVGLSQADLAGLVAASPKSVSRALAILRAQGLIATERRAIVVRDVDGLRDVRPVTPVRPTACRCSRLAALRVRNVRQ